MASRTTYTTTITVPVYTSWKCEECDEVNFSTGVIVCKREESTSSWRQSKQNEAKEMAANKAHEEWIGEAYKIISDPNHNASLMFSNFYVHNTNCTKCNKKPRWNKNVRFLWAIPPIFIGGLISLFAIISDVTSLVAWLFLLGIVGIFTLLVRREEKYRKMMPKLPKRYTPVIGSLNEELIAYATALGKTIPNPDECIEIIKSYDQIPTASTDITLPLIDDAENNASDNNTIVRTNFCRKCGVSLHEESGFCHKCGTEIITTSNIKRE